MKKVLVLLLVVIASLLCISAHAEETAAVPQSMMEAYEKQAEIARQQLLATFSKGTPLYSETRGAGYTDTDYCGNLSFTYKTNWSTTYVGNQVITYIDSAGGKAPYIMVMGYAMYNEDLEVIDSWNDSFIATTDIDDMISYKPARAGYLTFIFVLQDNKGNMISTNTPFVKITWEWRDDPFYTIGFADESAFGLTVTLDKSSVSVGDTVRGTFGVADTSLRKDVSATWYIVDDWNNVIDSYNWSGTEYSSFNYYIDYKVEYTGWLYFSVTVEDQYGRDVIVDTTKMKISGTSAALSGTASLNKSSVAIGSPVKATYKFINSNGKDEFIHACWTVYDGDDVYEKWIDLSSFSGSLTFTPTFGDALSFYVYAEDSEYYYWYETGTIPITGTPQTKPLTITGDYSPKTVVKGDKVTVNYTVKNGVAPYTINAYAASYTEDDEYVATLYSKENMPTSGSFTFTADSGDYVYFQVEAIDAQGFSFYYSQDYLWLEEPSRIPGDANDDGHTDIHDALLVMQYNAGWNVVINTSHADTNADSVVNLSDALLILQYAAGMDVTLR